MIPVPTIEQLNNDLDPPFFQQMAVAIMSVTKMAVMSQSVVVIHISAIDITASWSMIPIFIIVYLHYFIAFLSKLFNHRLCTIDMFLLER